MTETHVRAVVLDIEGTTGSASHVHEVLFPYARQRIANWLAAHRGDPAWTQVLRETRVLAGEPVLDEDGAATALIAWSDANVKAPPLKHVQGLIWADGYANGELTGHVYDDVPLALDRWQRAGIERYIYSSGSQEAQRYWFAYSDHGDLGGLLCGYFDLLSAGSKREPASYRTITDRLGVSAEATLFLSDVGEELDAAASAGWQTVAVRRPDDPRGGPVTGHRTVASLQEVLPDVPPGAAPAAGPMAPARTDTGHTPGTADVTGTTGA
ncbi:acireductone synthase [Streptomyces zagrosensis]|uniref:Enolase-phosphatase E1 n=1 Tax=Streptomyces zagrosensis TaxID=1042984 RepID=A0A7W9QBP5_9ACTN|nr:acireductone synthase [Streptomyces zagrosensis]MBB5937301.1 enolase-phosphatase E1 [Streptomyces zagrosensis]